MLPISQITDEKVALEIGLPDELLDFARMVNSRKLSGRADVTVRLTADLDMTGTKWVPIGFGGACFSGIFDGCGHTISAVTIQKKWPGNYGLFGYVTGAIQNVTVTGTIYNRSGEPHSAVGGIVGDLAGGVVRNCAADLVIDSNRRSLGFFAGGIAGLLEKGGLVQNCRSSVRVDNVLANFLYLGGVAGAVMDSRVERCTYTGAITVLGGEIYYIDVGGIAGNVQGRSSVTGCLNLGVLDASAYDFNCSSTGGIVGEIINKAVDRPVQVRNCVSLGELTCLGKDGPAHPITAYAEGAVFENNYYDESLPAQGREDLRAAVAAGCAAKPAAYLTSNEFLEDMERRGGRYALGTDGMLTVRELENGGNAYDDA